jgi:hypothetical protein
VEACEPVGGLSAEEWGGAVGSSVVKKEVEASESFLNTLDEAIDLGGDGEVGADDFGGGALLAKLAGQAESGGGAATMVEDEGVSHCRKSAGKKSAETTCGTGDEGDGLRGRGFLFHERIPRVRATARTFGISWVRKRSVLPKRASTAKSDSAERTSSWKNSKAWGRAWQTGQPRVRRRKV